MKDHPPVVLTFDVDHLVDLVAERVMARLSEATSTTTRPAYTAQTLAADLGVTPRAIRAAISRGELRAVKRGGRWIISSEAVQTWTSSASYDPRAGTLRPRKRRVGLRGSATSTPTLRETLARLDDDAA